MSNAQLTPIQREQAEMRGMLARRGKDIDRLGTLDSERLIVVAMNAYRKLVSSRKKADDPMPDKASLADCVMRAAQLGLEAGTDQAYLVPYKGKIQLIVGPRGLIDCAYRSERVVGCMSQVVIDGDEFEYDQATEVIRHVKGPGRPVNQEARANAITHAYSAVKVASLIGGKVVHVERNILVLTREDLLYYRSFSKATSGPWFDNFQGMAEKTALKQLFKRAPSAVRSPALDLALQEDDHGHFVASPELGDDQETAPALEPSRTEAVASKIRQQASRIRQQASRIRQEEPMPVQPPPNAGDGWEPPADEGAS